MNKYNVKCKFNIGGKEVEFVPSDDVIDNIVTVFEKEVRKKVGRGGLKLLKHAMIVANKINNK